MRRILITIIVSVLVFVYIPIKISSAITNSSPTSGAGSGGTYTYAMDYYDYSVGNVSDVTGLNTISAGTVIAAWPNLAKCWTQIYYLTIDGSTAAGAESRVPNFVPIYGTTGVNKTGHEDATNFPRSTTTLAWSGYTKTKVEALGVDFTPASTGIALSTIASNDGWKSNSTLATGTSKTNAFVFSVASDGSPIATACHDDDVNPSSTITKIVTSNTVTRLVKVVRKTAPAFLTVACKFGWDLNFPYIIILRTLL
jgi:hypothetical protein